MSKSFITNYIRIKDLSWESLSERQSFFESASFSDFMKSIYLKAGIDYPKFYKMDNLCKLAFISAELLLRESRLKDKYSEDEIGIVLENKSASIESDIKHAESFRDKSNYFPSPSIFVYTLPNIAIGEICIRNAIKGENAMYIFDSFDIDFSVDYINGLFRNDRVKCCIGGWLEYSEAEYDSFLFLVEEYQQAEQNNQMIAFDKEEIKKIYLKS